MPYDRTAITDLPGTNGPEIAAPNPVPLQAPVVAPATTGLEGLSAAFNNFFGGAEQGLAAVSNAAQFAQKQDIRANFYLQRAQAEMRNKEEAKQADAAALAGQPMDPKLGADYSYQTAYQQTAGKLHGIDLAIQWHQDVLAHAAPGTDLLSATNEWLKDPNVWGNGTGNPDYDAAALSTLKAQTATAIVQHTENSAKSLIATGLQNIQSVVADTVKNGKLDAPFIQDTINKIRAQDPAHPELAAARFAQMVRAGIQPGDPRALQSTMAALEKPGSAANGKSYAEMYPDSYKELGKSATNTFLNGISLQGAQAYSAFHDDLLNAKLDPTKLAGMPARLEQLGHQYGGMDQYLKAKSELIPILMKSAENTVGINRVGQMVAGKMPTVSKDIDKFFLPWLQSQNIDPYQNPEQAGLAVAKINMAPKDLKANMSRLLVDGSNPTGQQTALKFFQAIGSTRQDPEAAKEFINDPTAKLIYNTVQDQRAVLGDAALPNILSQVDANLPTLRKAKEIQWKAITGDTHEDDAMVKVRGALQSAFIQNWHHTSSFLPVDNLTIDPGMETQLEDTLKQAAILRGSSGQVDLQSLANEVAQDSAKSGSVDVYPAENGTLTLRVKPFADTDAKTGKPLIPLSPTVTNPATGQTEDTLATYKTDVASLSGVLPDFFGDPNTLSVAPRAPRGPLGKTPEGADGVYWLQKSGTRLSIGLGEKIAIQDPSAIPESIPGQQMPSPATSSGLKTVTVPKDVQGAAAFLHKIAPQDWLVLQPNDPVHPTAFWVGYQPHLTGVAPHVPTQAEMKAHRANVQDQLHAVEHPFENGAVP